MGSPNQRGAGKPEPKRARSEEAAPHSDLRPQSKHVRFAATPSETPSDDSPTPPLHRGMQQRSYRDALESVAAPPSPSPVSGAQPPANPGTSDVIDADKPPSNPAGAAAEGSGQGRSSPATLSVDQPTARGAYENPSESPALVISSTEGTPIDCGQKSRKGKEPMTEEEVEAMSHREAMEAMSHGELLAYCVAQRSACEETIARSRATRAERASTRLHSDLHQGSAPPPSRDPAGPGSSSAARPGSAEPFRGGVERGAEDSILYDRSFEPDPEPEEGNSGQLLYVRDGTLHSMPRSFRNASNETGDNSISIGLTCFLQYYSSSPCMRDLGIALCRTAQHVALAPVSPVAPGGMLQRAVIFI